VLLIAGSVFVFCGIIGGGLRLKELEIGRLPVVGRVTATAVGVAMLALGLVWSLGVFQSTQGMNPFEAPRILQVALTEVDGTSPVQESGAVVVSPGDTVLFWIHIESTSATEVGLGASIWSPNNEWIHDKRNDTVRHISVGREWIAREFHLPQNAVAGVYDVAFGVWDSGFQQQLTYAIRDDWIVIAD